MSSTPWGAIRVRTTVRSMWHCYEQRWVGLSHIWMGSAQTEVTAASGSVRSDLFTQGSYGGGISRLSATAMRLWPFRRLTY